MTPGRGREAEDAQLERLLHDAMALQAQGRLREGYECLRNWLGLRLRRGDRMAASAPAAVKIPGTTLCCVDCRDYVLAAHALTRCLERCRFPRALFFTDAEVDIDGVETVRIDRISSTEAYSHFMIKGLNRYISTEFALLVQYDGFVLNANCWSPEFQRYDYVGARWPADDWMSVGNGGFSLRSKRLLQALQDPEIQPLDPEDVTVCRTYRSLLEERHGIEFAPEDVAVGFSFETVPSEGPTFGFHGLGHLVNMFDMSDAEIAAYRPPQLQVRPR
jgi:hypothetical protein